MRELAPDVHLITGFPPYAINCYLVGDVLVDAMARMDGRRILKALRGRTLAAHALTHAHPDHQGASRRVCTELGVPFWVGEADVEAAEGGGPAIVARQPKHPVNALFGKVLAGPGHPVDRALREGDEVAGFTVLDVPGHSAGHIALWRESDGVLVAGDVLNNQHPILGFPRGLREPLTIFTPDPERNRASARRLGELRPSLVLLGHGPPVTDAGAFAEFCARL